MKILLGTHVFPPSIGGIESSSLDLALAFSKAGHEVQVITQTPSGNRSDDHGLNVIRRPHCAELIRAVRWCDIFFQNNISLQTVWPLLVIRRPWVVCTATWLHSAGGGIKDLQSRFKKLLLKLATNIYISRAVRDHVGYNGISIPNPYDNQNVPTHAGSSPAKKSRVTGPVGQRQGV